MDKIVVYCEGDLDRVVLEDVATTCRLAIDVYPKKKEPGGADHAITLFTDLLKRQEPKVALVLDLDNRKPAFPSVSGC